MWRKFIVMFSRIRVITHYTLLCKVMCWDVLSLDTPSTNRRYAALLGVWRCLLSAARFTVCV